MQGRSPQDTFPAVCVLLLYWLLLLAFLKTQQGPRSELLTGLSLTTAASWHLCFFCETSLIGLQSGGCTSRRHFCGVSKGAWCLKMGQVWTGPPEEMLQWRGKQRTEIQIPPVQHRSSADQGLPENFIPRLGCRDRSVNICEVGRALPAAAFPETSLCVLGWGSCSELSLGHLGLGLLQESLTGPAQWGWGRQRWDGCTRGPNLHLWGLGEIYTVLQRSRKQALLWYCGISATAKCVSELALIWWHSCPRAWGKSPDVCKWIMLLQCGHRVKTVLPWRGELMVMWISQPWNGWEWARSWALT